MKNPYTQSAIALPAPCRSCGYERGLVIIRFPNNKGFARCGKCDSPQYSIGDRQVEEIAS
jgi:predicted Zn-ribbon and HTH transcriptional regulator